MPPKGKKKAYSVAVVVAPGTTLRDQSKTEWKLGKDIAVGGFGRIYTAKQTAGKTVAVVKMEPAENGPLFQETHVFQRLAKPEMLEAFRSEHGLKFLGLPAYLGSGFLEHKSGRQRFLLMPLFGASLDSVRQEFRGRPELAFRVANSLLWSLQYLHAHSYVHADVKAENVLLSEKSLEKVVLVDFGLAKRLGEHPTFSANPKKAHEGTLPFTSLDAHAGAAPSFRGDLEILGYNLLYWLAGSLPWDVQDESGPRVMAAKEKLKKDPAKAVVDALGKASYAPEVGGFLKLAFSTDYSSKPDYAKARKLLTEGEKKAGKGASPVKRTGMKKAPVRIPSDSESEEDIPPPRKMPSRSKVIPGLKKAATKRKSTSSEASDTEEIVEESSEEDEYKPSTSRRRAPPGKKNPPMKTFRVSSNEALRVGKTESRDSIGVAIAASAKKPTAGRTPGRRKKLTLDTDEEEEDPILEGTRRLLAQRQSPAKGKIPIREQNVVIPGLGVTEAEKKAYNAAIIPGLKKRESEGESQKDKAKKRRPKAPTAETEAQTSPWLWESKSRRK